MGCPDRTLAAVVEGGWRLTFHCGGCRKALATYDSVGLLCRFGAALLATEAEVCARIRCEACGWRGAWTSDHAGDNISSGFDRDEGFTLWQQRDLRLRRLLREHEMPLEIADERWREVERKEAAHHSWAPRAPATDVYPLSPAGAAAVTKRTKAPV